MTSASVVPANENCGALSAQSRIEPILPMPDGEVRTIAANEFLFRRLSVEDVAEAHVVALREAPRIGFDTFIVSALTPFAPADCAELIADAPAVVARYFPDYRARYDRRGWTMFDSIDRVYDAAKAARRLDFVCRTGFGEKLRELAAAVPGLRG